jgi:bla regulator protein BlaR1
MTAYIIKTILCSAVFFVTFKLLFEKEKSYLFNRLYLLSGLLLSFAIPALTFSSSTQLLPIAEYGLLNSNPIGDNGIVNLLSPERNSNYIFSILLIVYITITTILFLRLVKNLHAILSTARRRQTISYNKAKIILIGEDVTPYSFLNYLFIYNKDFKEGNIENEILLHEYAHIRQKHSCDILLIEILQTVCWFNPFLFLYRKSIQLNHEFLADEAVISTLNNVPGYQSLLIDKANKSQVYNLTSQFNYSVIKKRLIMMTKTNSPKTTLLKQITVIPVLTLCILLFSDQIVAQDLVAVTETKNTGTPSTRQGASQELLNEYEQIVAKTKSEKGIPFPAKFSAAEKNRLQVIYLSMSREQQGKQMILFIAAPSHPGTTEEKNKYYMTIRSASKDVTVEEAGINPEKK